MEIKENFIETIVVGGGAAGMITAGRAAERGAQVMLIDKNRYLGKKLLLTGKGRCNVTNYELKLRKFIRKFGENGKFLYSSLHQFGVRDTLLLLERLGVDTKVERGNRVFPSTDRAKDIRDAFQYYLDNGEVELQTGSLVSAVQKFDPDLFKVITNKGSFFCRNLVIATGGKAFPGTGSTGDGYAWAKNFGHTVTDLKPSLVAIFSAEAFMKRLQGLSLKNVDISLWNCEEKLGSEFGEALFTDKGMSGPIILELSRLLVEKFSLKQIRSSDLFLSIDFKPALDFQTLDKRVIRDFEKYNRKFFKNSLKDLLPSKIIPVFVKESKINPNKIVSEITKEERRRVIDLLKNFRLKVEGVDSFDNAIVTKGGIELKEVNPKNMESKLVKGLYFVGEILDVDGPTGGYNLQMCWSTGYACGSNILK